VYINYFLQDTRHKTQHNTTQHNTTQHNTTQHNTTQHNTTQQIASILIMSFKHFKDDSPVIKCKYVLILISLDQ
jgi:hypothetical protein